MFASEVGSRSEAATRLDVGLKGDRDHDPADTPVVVANVVHRGVVLKICGREFPIEEEQEQATLALVDGELTQLSARRDAPRRPDTMRRAPT